jgi:hypothetical protein
VYHGTWRSFIGVNRGFWLFIDQYSASLYLQGLQPAANILSTEAPTDFGGNSCAKVLSVISQAWKKAIKNANLAWSNFAQAAGALDSQGLEQGAYILSTETHTGIVSNPETAIAGKPAPTIFAQVARAL